MENVNELKTRFISNPTQFFFCQNEDFDEEVLDKATFLSKQYLSQQNCPVCAQAYNTESRLPRILV